MYLMINNLTLKEHLINIQRQLLKYWLLLLFVLFVFVVKHYSNAIKLMKIQKFKYKEN